MVIYRWLRLDIYVWSFTQIVAFHIFRDLLIHHRHKIRSIYSRIDFNLFLLARDIFLRLKKMMTKMLCHVGAYPFK